ncbi:MAG: lipoyl(octanoyl) transferase LipB [Dehalococcoidia bacterium]|nr:lipoyl(octanoyl) transferase LipB [Dehalococcoidia bacterium]
MLTEKTTDRPPCKVSWLGTVEYQTAYELQKRLWTEKLNGRGEDLLLLLEHPPTLTLGKSGKLENLLVPPEELNRQGVSLYFTDRGGDVTYHGPCQLVVYPILDLHHYGKDIPHYICNLQEVIIRTLKDFSITARRDEKYVGVWVGNDKIAAIGVAVHRWVTMHGLALNVDPNLEHFNLINPCGIRDRGVTSMAKVLHRPIAVEEVARHVTTHFTGVFQTAIEWVTAGSLR